MPKFDANVWKNLHPPSTEGGGMVAALKDWQILCPEKYDDPKTDPKKLVNNVALAMKRLITAVTDAENKLGRDKSTDAVTKDKIAKTKTLLTKWETEANAYYKAVTKWSQDTLKHAVQEETEEKKNLQSAQLSFTNELVNSLQAATVKMPGLAREFDTAIKAGDPKTAQVKFNLHRDLLQKANFLVKPLTINMERNQIAARHKVAAAALQVPPKFNELARKLGAMNTLDGTMQSRLRKCFDGEEDDDKADPAYDNAVTSLVIFCKTNSAKIKAKIPAATQCLEAAKKLAAIRAEDPAYQRAMFDAHNVVERMFAVCKEVQALRGQVLGTSSLLTKKSTTAKLTPEDRTKFLTPILNLGEADMKQIFRLKDDTTTMLADWVAKVIKANPQARYAKTVQEFIASNKKAF